MTESKAAREARLARNAAQSPVQLDPLADLREEIDTPLIETVVLPAEVLAAPALATVADQATARAILTAAWHGDLTSQGFLHHGGQCGCHYLARISVEALLPLAPDGDLDGPQ